MDTGDLQVFMEGMKNQLSAERYKDIYTKVTADLVEYGPELLITGIHGHFYSVGLAEVHNIPSFWVDLQPLVPSAQYPSLVWDMYGLNWLGRWSYGLSHAVIVSSAAHEFLQASHPEIRFRREVFGITSR